MKIWKALIVDDERLARRKLRSMLAGFSEIEIIGEADSAAAAVQAIQNDDPDVIFLDIQMPRESGFELLEQIETRAKIIFVTAYDEYAIRAFEVNALDYLLKPVNPQRLAQTIERLSDAAEKKSEKHFEAEDSILANSGRKSKFVKIASIKCVTAAGVYSEILTDENEKFLFLRSLSEWEKRLPAKNFLRIHRSTIVNLDFIECLEKKLNQTQQIYLRETAEPLPVSRRYSAQLKIKFL